MRIVVAVLFCVLAIISAYGQSCDCPPASSCGTCSGGLTSLTLRYTGSTSQTITASDQTSTVFSQTVNPNETFTFSGSIPNDKFVGVNVNLTVGGAPDATIPSNCGSVFVGNVYGSFTVVAALSKTGGALCCSAAAMDAVPPDISNCPSNITISLPPSACEVAGNWTSPSATDNCTLASFTSTAMPTDLLPIGVKTVTYTAVDNYNNTSTCSFTVTVTDDTAPVISNCPANITIEATGTCGSTVSWSEPVAIDNCSASLTATASSGSVFEIGTTTVVYTATDPGGNTATCAFDVTVTDITAPLISGCPGNITMTVDGCESVVSWTEPTATDACLASLQGSLEPGSIFPLGTTTVTYTASDNAGNTSTCSFDVTLTTNGAPVVTGCPGDITLHTFDDSIDATWTPPQATPFCSELISHASTEPGSQFTAGTTSVVYEFNDGTKNRSTCTFNVIIIKDELTFEPSKAVTPNDDGVNDAWLVTNIEKFKDNTVLVVDRWGNRIYHSTGYDNTSVLWNGTGPNGSKVPVGTYFYTIEVRVNDALFRESGFIEVIY